MCHHFQAMILISVLIAVGTGPINMVVDFLFEDIISAPLEDEYKAAAKSNEIQNIIGRRFSAIGTAARVALRNSISAARKSITAVAGVSPSTTAPSQHERKYSLARLSSTLLEQFTVPDASTRRVPPSVLSSHSSTAAVLKGALKTRHQSSFSRQHTIFSHHNMQDIHNEDVASSPTMYESMERGEQCQVQHDNMLDIFSAEVLLQYEQLSDEMKYDFKNRWGFVADNGSNIWDDGFGQRWSWRNYTSRICGVSINRKDELSIAMEKVKMESEQKIAKLHMAPDNHIGLEVMHMFIIDLLG